MIEDENVNDADLQEEFTDEQETQVEAPPRTVPLEALEAERRKRQELEQQLRQRVNQPDPEDEDEDEEEFMTRAEFKKRLNKATFESKRAVLEEAYCDARPDHVEAINQHLETIIKRKPWLAQSIESAPNRYARAYEIVQDYMPKQQATSSKFSRPQDDAKKIVENSQKPGNPSTISKPSNMSQADYLKSIAGKPEFKEYRKKLLSGG